MSVLSIPALKAKIDEYIYSNNNREITGSKHNEVLNDVVDSLNALGVKVYNQESQPPFSNTGSFWYKPSTNELYISTGTAWVIMDITGSVDLDNLVANFVPYTGAVNDVDLNAHSMSNIDEVSANRATVNETKYNNIGELHPAHEEGLVFWDDSKKALSYYNENSEVTVNLGQELLIRVYNNSGSDIPNGKVVCPVGNLNELPTIALANAREKDKSRLVGLTTCNIPNLSYGYICKLGSVGGIDTSMFTFGALVYLSETQPGELTTSRPTDGSYPVIIGAIGKVDAVDGRIIVDINVGDNTVEVNDTNGFPEVQRTNTHLAFNNATRTFTISATTYPFHYYVLGEKFEQAAPVSVQIDNLEGENWFYFDAEGLKKAYQPSTATKGDIIRNQCFVASVYWNAGGSQKIELDISDERHGIYMSPATHQYLHITRGAQFGTGLGLSDFMTDASGSLPAHSQFSVASGNYYDEDLRHNINTYAVGSTIKVAYISGNSPIVLRSNSQTGYAFLNAPSGRVYYNQWTGTAWQLTEATNNYFVLYHIFAYNGVNDGIISIMGQNQYNNLASARDAAATEIGSITSLVPLAELVPLGTIIIETSNSFTSPTKSRIRTVSAGVNYIDWRTTELAYGVNPSSHSNLTDVQMAAAGVLQGHINDQAQTIAGVKTFANDVIVSGNLTVNGTTTTVNTQDLLVADNIVIINNGEVGAGVTKGFAGIQVDRGTLTDYQFLFDEVSDTFRIGQIGSLQVVATREDSPLNGGIASWDAATSKFVTVPASAVNYWTLDSGNVYRSTGNVYIGQTSGTEMLDVLGNIKGQDFITNTGIVRVNSLDGADNKVLVLSGGGSGSNTRGSVLQLYGNEATGFEGNVYLDSGNSGVKDDIYIRTRGTTRMFVEGSTGNVYIGKTSGLGAKFEVEGSVRVTNGSLGIKNTTSDDFYWYADANGFGLKNNTATLYPFFVAKGTANTTLQLGSLGVGIGGTPTQKFELFGSVGNIQMNSSGASLAFTRPDATYISSSVTGGSMVFVVNGLATSSANSVLYLKNNYDVVTNTIGGNFGVGVTTPVSKLDVNGNIQTTYGSGGTLTLFDADTTRRNRIVLGADATGAYIDASYGTGGTSNISLARTTGNVYIGQTSGSEKLDVNGNAKISGKIKNSPTASTASVTGAFNLDFSANYEFTRTLTGNATLSVVNATVGDVMFVKVTGNFTLAFGTGFVVLDGGSYDGSVGAYIGIRCAASGVYYAKISALA